jgi:hypothetical protein
MEAPSHAMLRADSFGAKLSPAPPLVKLSRALKPFEEITMNFFRIRNVLTFALFLLCPSIAHADAHVTFDRNEGAAASPAFKFKTVPSPLKNDAGAKATFSIVDGKNDPNGSNIRRLNDGRLPEDDDAPTDNFFFAQGSEGGRLAADLGSAIEIKQVNTYSWHGETRAPQVYKLYAADGTAADWNAAPKAGTDPTTCGWKLIASVDTRPKSGEMGGQYGVSIADPAGSLGTFRYFLFDISRTEERDPFGLTFFSEIDICAAKPAEPEVSAAGEAKPRAKDFEYTLDTSQSPQLKEWAETKLKPEIDKWYPIFVECLASDGYTAPKKFTVTIKPTRGVAYTAGTDVVVSTAWIEGQLKRPQWNEAVGSIIHELVHVVQQYKARGNPGWLVEGIADYYRWFHYEPTAHHPKLRSQRAKYTDSYQTTAGFLEFVSKNYDHELVLRMNAAMRQGRYSPELWKEFTGLTAPELWSEYVKTVFPGQNPVPGKTEEKKGN